ncbi:MAG: hypothetical protein LBG15_03260 [Dysgonamonadaceae bacterium]|jgi:hypothetical protein|nr:hypothetical protein [Dysgonamonadaceae bacterium]
MADIKISKFSSLSFENDWRAYFDKKQHYVQKIAQNEPIRIQFSATTQTYLAGVKDCNGQIKGVDVDELYASSQNNKSIYECLFAFNTTGFYEFFIKKDEENTIRSFFEVKERDKLEGIVSLRYTNRKNDFDTIFVSGNGEQKYFNFYIEGGIYPGEKSQRIENSIFRDQSFSLHQMSAIPYEVSVLTIGDAKGVPQWVGNKINHIFSLSDVKVNDEQMVRSESSVPEMSSISDKYPLYIFKISIEQSDHIDSLSDEDGSTYGRIFDYTFATIFN